MNSPRTTTASESEAPPPVPQVPTVQLCLSSTIDLSALRLDTGVNFAGVFSWTVCFHPKLAKVAMATYGCITEYDVISGSKLDSVELGCTPVTLQYLGDGVTLVFVTKERQLMMFNWVTRKIRTLYVAGDSKGDTVAMTHMHLAVSMGHRPAIYVSKHTSQAVRLIVPANKPGKKNVEMKMYSTLKKAIVGIASHPLDADMVLVAYIDGTVHGCTYSSKSTNLNSQWQVAVDTPKGNLMRTALKAEKHPFIPNSAILIVGTNTGALSVWELPYNREPMKLGHFNQGEGSAIVGAGIIATSCLLLVFLKSPRGALSSLVWRINKAPNGNTLLVTMALTPFDVWSAVEGAKPNVTPDSLTEDNFWRTLELNGTGFGFTNFGAGVRSGYDINRVVIHPDGYVIPQMTPTVDLLPVKGKGNDKISPVAAEAMQKVLSAPVLKIWDPAHPPNGSACPDVVPITTGLDFWSASESGRGRLVFPKDFIVLDQAGVRQYNLVGGSLSSVAEFPSSSSLLAHRIVHSEKAKAWLIFFNAKIVKSLGGTQFGDSEYTCLLQSREMQLSMGTMDTAPGLAGAFTGANDEYFAILSNDMRIVEVYRTATASSKTPVYVITLPGAGGYALFNAGVLMQARSVVERPTSSDSGTEKKKKKKDKDKEKEVVGTDPKWALWATEGGLQLSNLTDGERSIKDSAPGLDALLAKYPKAVKRWGLVKTSKFVPLNITEKVLQVIWQPLGAQESSSLAFPDGEPNFTCLGAIVTTERVLVVDGDLRLLAANAPSDSNVTLLSALWAGPALFFSTAAEEVYHFNWSGRPLRCFSLSSGQPSVLAAALPDRMYVVTRAENNRSKVLPRYFPMAQALLMGWAGLAAAGALPGGAGQARRAMAKILKTYDTSSFEATQLSCLVDAGFSDIALQIVRLHHADKLQQDKLAEGVAHCQAECRALVEEYKQSFYFPKPPCRSSVLYHRLVRCGRKCVMCALFSGAKSCFEAAGNLLELIPVLVIMNDKITLRRFGNAVEMQSVGMLESDEIARQLLSMPPHILQSSITIEPDPVWSSTYDGMLGQSMSADMAPIGSQPIIQVAYSENDRGTVTALDPAALKNYLEVDELQLDAGPMGTTPLVSGDLDFEEGSSVTPKSGITPTGSFTGVPDNHWSSDEEAAPTAAPTTAAADNNLQFKKTKSKNKDDDFFSSDEEDATSENTSFSGAPKFRITIKSKDEVAGNNTGQSLQRAAQSLRTMKWAAGPTPSGVGGGGLPAFLPPPPAPSRVAPLAPPQSQTGSGIGSLRPPPIIPPSTSFKGPGSHTPTTDGNSVDALLDFLGQSAPTPSTKSNLGPASAPASAGTGLDIFADFGAPSSRSAPTPTATPAGAVPSHVSKLYEAGISSMQAARWDPAIANLMKAFELTADLVRAGNSAAVEQFQVIVHHLAASRFMKGAAGTTRPPVAARLSRYPVLLKLGDDVRRAVVQKSIDYNMAVKNYGYCQELLMWLVTVASGNAPDSYLAQLQQQIAQCDRFGGRNENLPRDDGISEFPSLLATCYSLDELNSLINPLLR